MNIAPLFRDSEDLPLVLTPRSDARREHLCEYLAAHRELTHQQLLRSGAILFRGFRLEGADDFRLCTESLGARPFGYVGGDTPRRNVATDVYTSTEYPPSEEIFLHNEMSYLPEWPARLFFYCLIPSRTGGQTSLASGREVLRLVPVEIVGRLRRKRINYVRHFPAVVRLGKSWQATYSTQDRSEVEAIIARQGSTHRWLPDSTLRVETRCEAFQTHPETHEEAWFNQAEQWHPSALDPTLRAIFEESVGAGRLPHDCEYGDGEAFDMNDLSEIRQALSRSKLLFDWQPHDLLMLDNVLMMHGRESFAGQRRILAYLSST